MFLQVTVCPQGGGLPQCMLVYHHPLPRADPPWSNKRAVRILLECILVFTTRQQSLQRLYFYTCLSVILFTMGSTWAGTPRDQVHRPGTRYPTPLDQVPPGNRYTPGTRYSSRTKYTPQDQVPRWDQVHILLECIFVHVICENHENNVVRHQRKLSRDLIVYRMEFDKSRWSCSWNSDQNCTKLCQGHLLYMSPLAFWRQLSRILGQSEVNDNRTFDYLIDRLPIRWLLYLFMANLPINSHFNSSQIRISVKFLISKYPVHQ